MVTVSTLAILDGQRSKGRGEVRGQRVEVQLPEQPALWLRGLHGATIPMASWYSGLPEAIVAASLQFDLGWWSDVASGKGRVGGAGLMVQSSLRG